MLYSTYWYLVYLIPTAFYCSQTLIKAYILTSVKSVLAMSFTSQLPHLFFFYLLLSISLILFLKLTVHNKINFVKNSK